MKRCLIYLDEGQMQNGIDMLEVVRLMYPDQEAIAVGLAINPDFEEAKGCYDQVILVRDSRIKGYDQVSISEVILELQEEEAFDAILIPATFFGRMLAPRVSMGLNVGLVADVTAINHRNGSLEMIRPAFSGRLMAGITGCRQGPVMMSIRQGVFNYTGPRDKTTEIINYEPFEVTQGGIEILSVKGKPVSYDIRECDVLVSGGGGILKDFQRLEVLAEHLQGRVSASRKIVDKGIAERSIQVGQSGKTVSPDLYVAIGIYGAIQHVEGLKNVKHIISVNTNRSAPICSLSDIVVEGDGSMFIDKLNEKIKKEADSWKADS